MGQGGGVGVNFRILKSKTKSKNPLEGYNRRLDTAGERTRKLEIDRKSVSPQHTTNKCIQGARKPQPTGQIHSK